MMNYMINMTAMVYSMTQYTDYTVALLNFKVPESSIVYV